MIRLKIFIPAILLLCLVLFLAYFRLDYWVKSAIENGVSAITQTKTDISDLEISFKNSSLLIRKLEIASAEDEMKNAVEFENIFVGFEILPLLKKRFVMDAFEIKGIALGTKRRRSGRLPPKKKEPPSWLSKKAQASLDTLEREMADMPVAKLLDYSVPTDTNEIMNSLKLQSPDAFKAVMVDAEQMRGQWVGRFEQFRDFKEYDDRMTEARRWAQNAPQNPQEVLRAIESLKKNYDFFMDEKKRAALLVNDVDIDFKKIQRNYDSAKTALDADFERAKSMVSLDALNINNLSRMIFGPVWIERIETILRYHHMLRSALTSKKDEDVEVQKRSRGRDIIFLKEKALPGFVLNKAEFSVKGIEGGDQKMVTQVYALKLNNINSAPVLSGKPSAAEFKADLKDMMVSGVLFKALWDYTGPKPTDDFHLTLDRLKASAWPVGIPNLLPVKLEKGVAQVQSDLLFESESMKWTSKVSFKEVEWDLEELPRHGFVSPVLKEILNRVKDFSLEFEMKSDDKGLNLEIHSDLDKSLKDGIQAIMQKGLEDLQEKVRREVEVKVAAYREQANSQMTSFKNEAQKRVESYVQKATAYADEARKIQDSLQKKASNSALDGVKKNLPSLPNTLKGIKSPF